MKKLISLLLSGLMVLGLTACGGGGSKDPLAGNNDSPSGTTPKDGGVITVSVPSFGGDFIYGWGTSSYDAWVRYLIYSKNGLMTTDQNGEMIQNFMVDKYEKSDDGKEWTFNLKKDLKFSDGTDFTAKDVLFTYKFYLDDSYVKAGGSGATTRMANITGAQEYLDSCNAGACDASKLTGIEVIDDYTVKFTFNESYYATWYTTFGYATILSEKYLTSFDGSVDADGSINVEVVKAQAMQKPIGLGPYKMDEFVEGQYVKLSKNEYFKEDAVGQTPHIDSIILKIAADEVELDQLLAGDLDILAGEIDAEKINPVKADSKFAANGYPRHGYGLIYWHTDFGVTRYTEVRQALAYALDRDTFAYLFMGEYGTTVQGPYSTVYWMIDDEWINKNLTNYTFDPAKVAEILEGAGWAKGTDGIYAKDGEKLIINIGCGTQSWVDNLNLITADSLKDCGIQFNFSNVDFSVLMTHAQGSYTGGEKDRIFNGFAMASTLDPVFDGYAGNHSSSIQPWGEGKTSISNSRFVNADNDRLLKEMRECDPSTEEGNKKYQELYLEWVKLQNTELPSLPMYSCEYYDLYNAKIKNFSTSSLWEWTQAIVGAWVE